MANIIAITPLLYEMVEWMLIHSDYVDADSLCIEDTIKQWCLFLPPIIFITLYILDHQ